LDRYAIPEGCSRFALTGERAKLISDLGFGILGLKNTTTPAFGHPS
jgi:hypothetical protein